MKHNLITATLCTIVLLMSGGCNSYQPVDHIDGIRSIVRVDKGVRMEVAGPLHIWKPAQAGHVVELKPGEELSIGDGYHFTATVLFVGPEEGALRFRVETINRPPNEPAHRSVELLAVHDG